jgi:beta-phosphoglucomutase-like phosphatase (HAD superfamily)
MSTPLATDLPGAVIFDLDGTLVDTVERRIVAWLQAFEEAGIPASRDAVSPLIGADGKAVARRIAKQAGRTLDDDTVETIDRRSGEIYQALNVDPRPLPGARELAAALELAGIPWAIGTSSRREQVRASVDALMLGKEPTIVDGSHVEHAKPAPDLLLMAADQLQAEPTRVWYVGDSTFDMQAAVSAGMHPIGVTTGSADADALREAGAEEVIPSLLDLEQRISSSADQPASGA